MKKLILVSAILFSSVSYGQVPTPSVNIYKQLLSEANERIAVQGTKIDELTARVQELEHELAEVKK